MGYMGYAICGSGFSREFNASEAFAAEAAPTTPRSSRGPQSTIFTAGWPESSVYRASSWALEVARMVQVSER